MALYDLNGAKPIEGYKSRRTAKRTMDPANYPQLASGRGSGAGFAGATVNRLTGDIPGRNVSADTELFADNRLLRGRARHLAVNNPFAIKFLAEVVQNVVGDKGIQLQAKIVNQNGQQTAATRHVSNRIEEEWWRWGKVGRCTADGRFSWVELQQLAVQTVACEGENLVKQVLGRQFNSCGFALQPLDMDQLDETLMQSFTDGSEIRMGIEVDQYRRPLAYHLWNSHPQDMVARNRARTRVPAEYIVHTARWMRPAQTRGYTWLSGAILDMAALDRYSKSVDTAAAASAAKFYAIEHTRAEGWDPLEDEDGTADSTEPPVVSANPGEGWDMEEGATVKLLDPRFPGNNHADFMKTQVRKIATGLLMDFPTLGNDLSDVNFSSIRAGLLDERDCWKIIQEWFINHFVEPIFQAWLDMALLTTLSDITLTLAQRDQIEWKPRGWPWVDPLKDTQANVLKLENALDTYSNILASQGMDFEEVMTERAYEQAFIEELGLVLGTDIRGVADTANDDQAGTGANSGARSLSGDMIADAFLPAAGHALRLMQKRTPEQIEAARERYRERHLLQRTSD